MRIHGNAAKHEALTGYPGRPNPGSLRSMCRNYLAFPKCFVVRPASPASTVAHRATTPPVNGRFLGDSLASITVFWNNELPEGNRRA